MIIIKSLFGCCYKGVSPASVEEEKNQQMQVGVELFEKTLTDWVNEDSEYLGQNSFDDGLLYGNKWTKRRYFAGNIMNVYLNRGDILYTKYLNISKVMPLIGCLENLTSLQLQQSTITNDGSMPESICNLTNLIELEISNCSLTNISKKINKLIKLSALNLSENQFSSFPISICELRNLENLNLYHSHITEIPENIKILTKLKTLNLSCNALRSYSQTLSSLVNLNELTLTNCSMILFPEQICRITNLQTLEIAHNQLTDIPESFSQLVHLQMLFIDHNRLVTLPDAIINLRQLKILSLQYNNLRILPENIGGISALEHLCLQGNLNLISLPISLGNCTLLNFIDINPNLQEGLRHQVNAILTRTQNARMLNGLITLPARITSWVCYCGTVYNERDYSFIFAFSEEEQGQIGEWLLRLEACRDFRSNNKKLAIFICDILKSLQSQEFKNTFFCLLADNLTACGDRAGMLLNLIYTDWQLNKLSEDSQAADKDKILLMKGVAKTMVLRNTVDSMIKKFEKDSRDNLTEDVEIRLYFEVTLKEALGLVTAIDEMVYEQIGKRHDVVNENKLKEIVNDTFLDVFYELTSLEQFICKHKQHGTEYISKKEKIKALAVSKLENISKKNDEGFYTNFEDYGFACGEIQQQLKQELVNLRKHYVDILEA